MPEEHSPAAASCAVTSSATVEEERRSESSKGLSGLDGGSLRSSADIMEWLTTATFSVEFMSAEEFIPAGGPGWPTAVPCGDRLPMHFGHFETAGHRRARQWSR